MDQKIPLDRDSFEQIVATASILQRLQKRTEYLKTQIEGRPGDLTDLIETQQEIQTGSLSTEAALLRIVTLSLKLLPAGGAAVWLYEGEVLAYRAGSGTASDDDMLREAVRSRLSDRPSAEPHAQIQPALPSPYASLLVAPVLPGPKIAGALAVFSEVSDVFSEPQTIIVRLLAGLVANAIDKAASAQFKQMVSLERAVVRRVIDSTVPRLSGLIEIKEHSFPGSGGKQVSAQDRDMGQRDMDQRRPFVDFTNAMSAEALAEIEREMERYQQPDLATSTKRIETEAHAITANPQPVLEILGTTPTAPILGPGVSSEADPEHPIGRLKMQPRLLSLLLAIMARVRTFPIGVYAQHLWNQGANFFRNRFSVTGLLFFGAARKIKFLALAAPKNRIALRLGLFAAVLIVMAFAVHTRSPKASTAADKPNHNAANVNLARPAKFPFSHKISTDPQIANALREMSAFEIPGLRRQAKYGDASAAFQLGMAYETGRGVPQNCRSASEWVREAASAGDAAAEYNLGLRYREGDGVPINITESDKWIYKAAEQKYSQAELTLKMAATRTELSRP